MLFLMTFASPDLIVWGSASNITARAAKHAQKPMYLQKPQFLWEMGPQPPMACCPPLACPGMVTGLARAGRQAIGRPGIHLFVEFAIFVCKWVLELGRPCLVVFEVLAHPDD